MAPPRRRFDHAGSPDDLLDLNLDEVVERVEVLLDKAAHLEERRKQPPLLLHLAHRRLERLLVVQQAGLCEAAAAA